MSFFDELKRHNVFRVGIAHVELLKQYGPKEEQ